jgi:hypothetical protein
MLACPMISCRIFGGYPVWIMNDAVRLKSCTRSSTLILIFPGKNRHLSGGRTELDSIMLAEGEPR